jgi:hypothetical protein
MFECEAVDSFDHTFEKILTSTEIEAFGDRGDVYNWRHIHEGSLGGPL